MKKNEIKLIPNKIGTVYNSEEKVPNSIKNVGSNKKWNQGVTGKGVVVAVIDTGCDLNHPDLSNRIIGGYNFTEEHNGNVSIFLDMNGHGTHTAGIIAASRNGQGIVGVAPDAQLLILKTLNKAGSGSINNLIEAIYYAIDWRGPLRERVRVISLSLGTKTNSSSLHQAVKRAVESGISVVVSSGNDGDGNSSTAEYRYPGAFEEVIEVGAVGDKNEIANFTNTNEFIDLYGPGVNILSTFIEQKYAVLSGTSMAAPHVAGAIALIIEEYEEKSGKELSEKEIYDALMDHTMLVEQNEPGERRILTLTEEKEKKIGFVENKEMLFKCFCQARKTQSYFTHCLDEKASKEERDFILDLIKESAESANKIREFCKKN